MTPDQFLSTLHRQRADSIAIRQAMSDLANCLPAPMRDAWLSALRARIATIQTAAQAPNQEPDLAAGLQANATALEFLTQSLAQGQRPKMTDD